ncbi:hypothetical protein GCM10009660_07040 [Catellatospora bangladeshensis]
MVLREPCPAMRWRWCTGTPASAIQVRPVWRRLCRRRCVAMLVAAAADQEAQGLHPVCGVGGGFLACCVVHSRVGWEVPSVTCRWRVPY